MAETRTIVCDVRCIPCYDSRTMLRVPLPRKPAMKRVTTNVQQKGVYTDNAGVIDRYANDAPFNSELTRASLRLACTKFKVDSSEFKLMITEPDTISEESRREMHTMLLGELKFHAIKSQPRAVLALYSEGLKTGLVIDSGADSTHIVPVNEGTIDPHQIMRLPFAGNQITQYLSKLMELHGICIPSHCSGFVQKLKERVCFVAVDYSKQVQLARETTALLCSFALPDGQRVSLSTQRFQAPEALFNPVLLGLECLGLSDAIHTCINSLPLDVRRDMYRNILLSGGNTTFPGLITRLKQDLERLYVQNVLKGDESGLEKITINVVEPSFRGDMVFAGASVLAAVYMFDSTGWITKENYCD